MVLLRLQMVKHVFNWNDMPAQKALGLHMVSKENILIQIQGAKPVPHWILWTILIGRTWCWPWTHKNIQCCMSVLTSGMMLTYINIWLPFGTVFKLRQGNIQSLLISLLCLFKKEPSRSKSDKGRRN